MEITTLKVAILHLAQKHAASSGVLSERASVCGAGGVAWGCRAVRQSLRAGSPVHLPGSGPSHAPGPSPGSPQSSLVSLLHPTEDVGGGEPPLHGARCQLREAKGQAQGVMEGQAGINPQIQSSAGSALLGWVGRGAGTAEQLEHGRDGGPRPVPGPGGTGLLGVRWAQLLALTDLVRKMAAASRAHLGSWLQRAHEP